MMPPKSRECREIDGMTRKSAQKKGSARFPFLYNPVRRILSAVGGPMHFVAVAIPFKIADTGVLKGLVQSSCVGNPTALIPTCLHRGRTVSKASGQRTDRHVEGMAVNMI